MKMPSFAVLAILLCALASLRLSPSLAGAAPEPMVVVAGLAFPGNDIAFANLKSTFRGQSVSIGGKHVIPINHPLDSPLRVAFDRAVLSLEPAAVGRFWVDMRIRDEGKPPTTASSSELAQRIAASLPGAITYANKALLNAKLKVLTIDGKAAGQAGYALK
ncbi:MAG: hypothetical protein RLZZ450_5475 [Pseudomonadota bacterium]|jgi:hypothetical protein